MRITAELQATGGTTTGFRIGDAVVAELGGGNRPKVVVKLNGYEYRSSIARMGGEFWLGVSADRRAAAGVEAGDVVELEITLDTAERAVEVPAELAAALAAEPAARERWEALSYSRKRQYAEAVAKAKAAETRARRVARTIEELTG